MRYAKYIFIIAALWVIFYAVSNVLRLQARFVFNPAMPVGAFIEKYPGPLEKYTVKTTGGNEIVLWVTGGDARKPVIILSHGRSAHDFTLLPLINTLRSDGNIVIIYSYSGYPPSTGRPSEKNTYDDLAAVVNFAKTNFNKSPADIILAGHSLGAAVAIDAAARGSYKAVIAMVPFSSVKDMLLYWSRRRPVLKIFRLLPVRYRFDSVAKAGKITSPFYLFYTKEDDITPYFMAEKLARKNTDTIIFPSERGHHNDIYWFAPDLAAVIRKINKN